MKKRTLAISDIHGCYDELIEILTAANYDSSKDQLIFVGDYVDRGKDSLRVLEFVKLAVEKHGAVALRGNHDDMFNSFLQNPADYNAVRSFLGNGGHSTVQSFLPDLGGKVWMYETYVEWANEIKERYSELVNFVNELPYYHETDEHLFIHAGINPHLHDWRNTSKDEMIWIRDAFLKNDHQLNKTVITGHTPTITMSDSAGVLFGRNKIHIDGACAYGYQLNCLIINEDGSYDTLAIKSNRGA